MFVPSALAIAAALWIAYLVALTVEKRIFDQAIRRWKSLSKLGKCVVALVLIGFIAFAGTKPDSGGVDAGGSSTNDVSQVEGDCGYTNEVGWIEGDLDGTNDVDQVGGDTNSVGGVILNAPRPTFAGAPSLGGCGSVVGTPAAGAEGFSLVSVGHDETFDFTPPETAVVATNWLLHGASTQPLRLSFEDWIFPYGEEGYSNFTVFAYGEVMPGEVNTNHFLVPFGASLGIAPAANWERLGPTGVSPVGCGDGPDGQDARRPSLFWHGMTPSNTLLLTWQNALLGREASNPVSFQAELKPSGGFVFRYDLSRLVSDEPLSNAVIMAQSEDANFTDAPTTNLTSPAFQTHDERVCDENREDFDEKIGDEDPYAYPEGSTNTVLEHVFYSGTTNGAFAYPQSTDGNAVLMVSVSGSGSGELMVGSTFVPLVGRPAPVSAPRLFAAPPPSPSTLAVTVPRGSTQKVYMRGDSTLSVSFSSEDFAFGALPDLSGRHFGGWINFPFVNATVPCIHDYNAKKKLVSLPLGDGAGELTCEWQGTSQIEVENIPPVSAMLTGHFSGRTTTPVTYTLSHPNYLFGQTTYSQTARYCPQPPEDEDEDDPPSGDPSWYDGDDDDDDEEHYCWCCFWGSCYPGCGCGCACDIGEGDDEPDEPVDPEPEDYDEASTNYPHMSGILKIRDPLEYTAPIHLTVPLEHRNCCPCPDHATNWVSVVYKSNRLKVVDAATEMDFSSSGESLDVKIAGVSPSFDVGDAGVSFAANGDVCLERAYTVLGVGINGGYIPNVGDADLKMLNECNSQFGLPIPINTNLWNAVELKLQTNVRLPSGNIHLGFEDSTAPFEVWIYDSWVGEYRKLTSSSGSPLDISFAGWRQLVGGSSDSYSPTTCIYITAADAGKATLVYKYWGVIDGKIVEDEARQVITAVTPSLIADYNRDGAIDDDDIEIFKSGRPYRYWTNQCKIDGNVWAEPSLFERIADLLVGNENSSDDRVNGTFDLLNLFPVAIDVGKFRQEWGSAARFVVEPTWGSFNYTLVNKSWSEAGKIRTEACSTFGGEALSAATMNVMTNSGVQVDASFLSQGDRSAMLVAEARARSYGMRLRVELGGVTVFAFELPMQITPVDEMFRFVSLRGAYDDEIYDFSSYGPPPSAGTDEELWNKDVFFVHGFNVSEDGAREWNREIFKRLWVSGSMARYWGVTWSGDYHIASEAFNGLHYHRDVRQALLTAPSFARLVNSRGHDAVVIGHSLGNMVVSESLLKGCNAAKYFMLDAAVASEAYRSTLQARVSSDPNYNRYVPEDWHGYDPNSWAANWYSWFQDDRGSLGWAGHFASLLSKPGLEIYNYYSTGDEVFAENDETPGLATGVFHWPTLDLEWPFVHLNLELDAYPWQKQEVFKGVSAAGSLSAGWGFHVWNDGLSTVRYSAVEANQLVANGTIVTNAVFNRDVEAMFQPSISDIDKADILASHIPAVSSPAGKVSAVTGYGNENRDLNTEIQRPNGWGRGKSEEDRRWLHSDIKNMAYYYLSEFYNEILNKGGLK